MCVRSCAHTGSDNASLHVLFVFVGWGFWWRKSATKQSRFGGTFWTQKCAIFVSFLFPYLWRACFEAPKGIKCKCKPFPKATSQSAFLIVVFHPVVCNHCGFKSNGSRAVSTNAWIKWGKWQSFCTHWYTSKPLLSSTTQAHNILSGVTCAQLLLWCLGAMFHPSEWWCRYFLGGVWFHSPISFPRLIRETGSCGTLLFHHFVVPRSSAMEIRSSFVTTASFGYATAQLGRWDTGTQMHSDTRVSLMSYVPGLRSWNADITVFLVTFFLKKKRQQHPSSHYVSVYPLALSRVSLHFRSSSLPHTVFSRTYGELSGL